MVKSACPTKDNLTVNRHFSYFSNQKYVVSIYQKRLCDIKTLHYDDSIFQDNKMSSLSDPRKITLKTKL